MNPRDQDKEEGMPSLRAATQVVKAVQGLFGQIGPVWVLVFSLVGVITYTSFRVVNILEFSGIPAIITLSKAIQAQTDETKTQSENDAKLLTNQGKVLDNDAVMISQHSVILDHQGTTLDLLRAERRK